MVIALDAMGGDYAPQSIVEGAIMALQSLPKSLEILLTGSMATLEAMLADYDYDKDRIKIAHAPEVIEMAEHPTRAFQAKPNSSIALGFKLMATGEAQAFCSAGNTGAMMVGAMLVCKPIPGILRPAICGFAPRHNGKLGVILDVGANAELKPEALAQFGEMGSLYAKAVLQIDSPKVALMNMGEEEKKGPSTHQAAYQIMKENNRINFVGNIEGRDLFEDKSDVVVCDGFTGNIILKLSESIFDLMHAAKIKTNNFFDQLNYEAIGGSPIIGINGNVVIGHGVSSPTAVLNMIRQAMLMVEADITEKLKLALAETAHTN